MSGPSSGARALAALDARFAAYDAMTLDYDLPAGATREDEDRLLIGRLKEVSGEAARLEKAYQDVISLHDDPRAAVLAQIAIGDCKEALREDMLDAPAPSYLTAEQAEVYRQGLEDKSYAAEAAARDAWDRAAELADALGGDPEIEALLAGRRPGPE